MKTQLNHAFKAPGFNEKEEETNLYNEIAVPEGNMQKPFTVADLWNIQRQKKTLVRRRYFAD
jgi:hypothetical protein